MFDIGLGEILVLAVVGLLIFGPDRLPNAARDLARTIRHIRTLGDAARHELTTAAGLDPATGETLADLHPRKLLNDLLTDTPDQATNTGTDAPDPGTSAVTSATDPATPPGTPDAGTQCDPANTTDTDPATRDPHADTT